MQRVMIKYMFNHTVITASENASYIKNNLKHYGGFW